MLHRVEVFVNDVRIITLEPLDHVLKIDQSKYNLMHYANEHYKKLCTRPIAINHFHGKSRHCNGS